MTDRDELSQHKNTGRSAIKNSAAPHKEPLFYLSYLFTLGTLCVASTPLLNGFGDPDWWARITLTLCIPAIIVGMVIWAILKRRNAAVALGILFSSQTPFFIICILSGGCGLYTYWT